MTICSKCGKYTETKAFATFRTRSGEVKRRGICKECRNKRGVDNFERLQEYRKEYNQKNKTQRVKKQSARRIAAKEYTDSCKNVPCADCGKIWPPVAMDFDHVNGGKVKTISSMVSQGYRLELIKEEIAKCEVVCACCHRIRTSKRNENIGKQIFEQSKHTTRSSDTTRASDKLTIVL